MASHTAGYCLEVFDFAIAAVGGIVVAVVAFDVFCTVLWSARGGGPLTTTILAAARRVCSRCRGHRIVRSAVGPAALVATALTWTSLLLVGFTLTTQVDPDALRSTTTGVPADWYERAYTVGYTMFTLGNGDFGPSSDLMRTLIVVVNATGMLLVTLSVTYLIPIVAASVTSRAFAESILSLGDDPGAVVSRAWDGTRVQLDDQIRSARAELGVLAHQHLAYPVLHLFDSPDPSASAPAAVRRLDEVLTLLDAVAPAVAPPAPSRDQLRSSISRYSRTYGTGAAPPAPPPAAPSLRALRDAGIPLRVDHDEYLELVAAGSERRARLHAIAATASADQS